MSHEIMQHDKQQGREMAWHGLTDIKPDLTLANCWLNEWDYLPKVVTIDGKATPFRMLGVTDNCQVETVGDNGEGTGQFSPLTIGDSYRENSFKPVLNARLLELLAPAEKAGLTLESAGSVFNRGCNYLSFLFPEGNFQVAGQDYKAYLNYGNGNNQTMKAFVNTSNTKTVCANTLQINLNSAGLIMEVKKTRFSDLKLADMGRAIETMLAEQKKFAKLLTLLCETPCDEKTAMEFFAGFLAPSPELPLSTRAANTLARLVQLFSHGAGNDGNDWNDVFQAVTDYFTHEAASAAGNGAAQWKNFQSSEFGAGKKAKIEAWAIVNDKKLRNATVTVGRKVLKLTADAARKAE